VPRRNKRRKTVKKPRRPQLLTPRPMEGSGKSAHLRWRSCQRKKKRTKRDAEQHAEQLRRKDGARMHAYRCAYEDCVLPDGSRSWHVGHVIPRTERKRRH